MLRKRNPGRRLAVEVLESRTLLASNIVATFDSGVLRVEGTPGADQIVIHKIGSEIKVNNLAIKNAAGRTIGVPVSQVRSVSIDALGGNDLIWVKGNLGLQVQLKTGAGADLVAAGPATNFTSSDIGSSDLLVSTSNGVWKQLEAATRDPQGTFAISKLDIPSGIPGLPNVSLTNVRLRITADSIQLITGTFTLPVVGGSVTLSGTINKDGKFNFASVPVSKKIGAFTLAGFKATVTNEKVAYEGSVKHSFLGAQPIRVTGDVNVSSATYSLRGIVPNRTLFGGNLALSKQVVYLEKSGLKFTTDARLVRLNATVAFEGMLAANGTYNLTAGFNGNLAGISVSANRAFTWDSAAGIKVNFAGTVPGMPAESSGQTSAFSFSGTYGPTNWSITGRYNKPIQLGWVTLTDIAVTLNKDKANGNDFVEISAVGSFQGWKALANVKGNARFYRDGRYSFALVGSLIDTAQLTSALGGYKLSEVTAVATNMQVTKNASGQYVINENIKTSTVSTVVHGNLKAGGFNLSRFSGIINSNGYYEFQSVERVPIPWSGVDIARATLNLKKGEGLTVSSFVNLGPYRSNFSGTITPAGNMVVNGSSGSINGLAISNSSFRGELNSTTRRYSFTIRGNVNTPIGNAAIESNLSGTGSVPVPQIRASVSLSGPITKLFTGSVAVNLSLSTPSFSGNVNVKGIGVSVSVSGSFTSGGTVTVNGHRFSLSDLSGNNVSTAGRLLKAVGLSNLNIALAIVRNVSTAPSDVARGLVAAQATWNSIASTLWSSSVKSNLSGGLTFSRLGVALKDAGLSNNVTLAVAVGKIGGVQLYQIGQAVNAAANSWSSTASALWSSQVKALYTKGINLADLGYALRHAGLGTNYHSIALNVGRVGGMTLTNLVTAVRGAGASWDQAAKALWYTDIDRLFRGGFKVGDLGKALSSAGLGRNYHQIALSVGRVGGMYLSDLAKAVYHSRPEATLTDVVRALWYDDIDRLYGGVKVGGLIAALRTINPNLRDIANALHRGGVFSSLNHALAAVGLGGGGGLPNPFPRWF
jgi:hypothetical protein